MIRRKPRDGQPAAEEASQPGEAGSGRKIRAVDRALKIVQVLSEAGCDMRLNEIATATGLNISTCHHLLSTLQEHGYVAQSSKGRAYFLGGRIVELSVQRVRQIDLVDAAKPVMKSLRDETGETIHLTVLQGYDLITLQKFDSRQAVRVGTDSLVKRRAAHATASGKCMLAWLPRREVEWFIAEHGLQPFTEFTLTSAADLMHNLASVRHTELAYDREEFELGVICVGTALRDHAGAVLAAITCSLPRIRATRAHLDSIAQSVLGGGRVICDKISSAKPA